MKSMKFFAFLLASGLMALVLSVGMTAKDEADISGAIRSEDQYPAPALDSAGAGSRPREKQAAGYSSAKDSSRARRFGSAPPTYPISKRTSRETRSPAFISSNRVAQRRRLLGRRQAT